MRTHARLVHQVFAPVRPQRFGTERGRHGAVFVHATFHGGEQRFERGGRGHSVVVHQPQIVARLGSRGRFDIRLGGVRRVEISERGGDPCAESPGTTGVFLQFNDMRGAVGHMRGDQLMAANHVARTICAGVVDNDDVVDWSGLRGDAVKAFSQ